MMKKALRTGNSDADSALTIERIALSRLHPMARIAMPPSQMTDVAEELVLASMDRSISLGAGMTRAAP